MDIFLYRSSARIPKKHKLTSVSFLFSKGLEVLHFRRTSLTSLRFYIFFTYFTVLNAAWHASVVQSDRALQEIPNASKVNSRWREGSNFSRANSKGINIPLHRIMDFDEFGL